MAAHITSTGEGRDAFDEYQSRERPFSESRGSRSLPPREPRSEFVTTILLVG
jgi:hypothetical protein